MATIRPNRPTGAAVALVVLLGVVALAAVVGLTAAGGPTGESGLTTRPWTAEQMSEAKSGAVGSYGLGAWCLLALVLIRS
jgi:hypothetical protein